jgi:hypothetical protein
VNKTLKLMVVLLSFIFISALTPGWFLGSLAFTGGICSANGFVLDQNMANSQGTVNRYIDISSPFSGAYLYENLTVVGRSEITDSFTMDNLPPGVDATQGFDIIEDIFDSSPENEPAPAPPQDSSTVTEKTLSSGGSASDDTAVLSVAITEDFGLQKTADYDWFELF